MMFKPKQAPTILRLHYCVVKLLVSPPYQTNRHIIVATDATQIMRQTKLGVLYLPLFGLALQLLIEFV